MEEQLNMILNNRFVFGELIRLWRLKLGWSRRKLALQLDMHASSVQRYEEGQIKNITFDILEKFTQALDLTTSRFLDPDMVAAAEDAAGAKAFQKFDNRMRRDDLLHLEVEFIEKVLTRAGYKIIERSRTRAKYSYIYYLRARNGRGVATTLDILRFIVRCLTNEINDRYMFLFQDEYDVTRGEYLGQMLARHMYEFERFVFEIAPPQHGFSEASASRFLRSVEALIKEVSAPGKSIREAEALFRALTTLATLMIVRNR